MIGSWTLVTPPTEEPVTLAEIKDHLRVSSTAEDSLLTLYAQMAREAVEGECWRADAADVGSPFARLAGRRRDLDSAAAIAIDYQHHLSRRGRDGCHI